MGKSIQRHWDFRVFLICLAIVYGVIAGGVAAAQYHGIWKDSIESPSHNFYIQHYSTGSTVVVYTQDAITFHAFLGEMAGNVFDAVSLDPDHIRRLVLTFDSGDSGAAVLLDNAQFPATELASILIQKVFPALRTDRSGIWKDPTETFNLYVQDYAAGATVALYTYDGVFFRAFLGRVEELLFEAAGMGYEEEQAQIEFLGADEGFIYLMTPGVIAHRPSAAVAYSLVKKFAPPVLDIGYEAAPRFGPAPLQVQFTDSSTVFLSSYHWDFGDGATSTAKNPVHTYAAPGIYDVTRSVVAGSLAYTSLRTEYVHVSTAPNVQISGAVTHSGSGTPLTGVTLTFSGGLGTVLTNDLGQYTHTVPYGWSGTVTPSRFLYTFTPKSLTYADVTSNQTGQDYTGTMIVIVAHTISGTITSSGGSPIAGVTLTFSPDGGQATTDSEGNYSHTVIGGWSGTVTPSKFLYTFTPKSLSYINVTSNQTGRNYTGSLIMVVLTHKISGKITTSGGTPIAGVTLTFSNEGGETTTDSDGKYSHTVNHGWSGTADPFKLLYSFTPSNRSYPAVTLDKLNQDYTGAKWQLPGL